MINLSNPALPVEYIQILQNSPQDSWMPQHVTNAGIIIPTDIKCSMCPGNLAIIDEGQLALRHAIAFVQVNPCGHYYCTHHFEVLLRASAERQHTQAPLCQGPDCRCAVLVQTVPVSGENLAPLEMRECQLQPSLRRVWELRFSIRALNERVLSQIGNGGQAAAGAGTVNQVAPAWVFVVEQTHFNFPRLVQLLREILHNNQLFPIMNNVGNPIDPDVVARILDGNTSSLSLLPALEPRAPRLVLEAKQIPDEPTPVNMPPPPNFGVAPPPPFLLPNVPKPKPKVVNRTDLQKPSGTPPFQQPAPVYGLKVSSVMGAFLHASPKA